MSSTGRYSYIQNFSEGQSGTNQEHTNGIIPVGWTAHLKMLLSLGQTPLVQQQRAIHGAHAFCFHELLYRVWQKLLATAANQYSFFFQAHFCYYNWNIWIHQEKWTIYFHTIIHTLIFLIQVTSQPTDAFWFCLHMCKKCFLKQEMFL